jgi:pilus assembly protein FimV
MPWPWVASPSSPHWVSPCALTSTSPRSPPKKPPASRQQLRQPEAFRAAGLEYNAALGNLRHHAAAPSRMGAYFCVSAATAGQRALHRPDPGSQLVVRAHRARLHDAARPAQLAARPHRRAPSVATGTGRTRRPPAPQRPAPAAPPPRPAAPAPAQSPCPPRTRRQAGTTGCCGPGASRPAAPADEPGHRAGRRYRRARLQRPTSQPSVSLDQMLVALLRANEDAFIGGNLNRLKAGAVLTISHRAEQAACRGRRPKRQPDRDRPKPRLQRFPGQAGRSACLTVPVAAADRKASGTLQAQVDDKKPAAAAPRTS